MAELKSCPFCGEDGAESGESSVPAIGGGKKIAVYCNCCFARDRRDSPKRKPSKPGTAAPLSVIRQHRKARMEGRV